MKKAKKGFTLVELIVAIAILSILATVAVVGYTGYVNKAKDAKAEMELSQIVAYINAELADDEWKVGDYTVKMSTDGKITVDGGKTLEDIIKTHFKEIFEGEKSPIIKVDDKKLTYTTSDGGTASMTLN
jgi:prepilin-type N-terminal cleavage/methylation domain-containing protein